MDMNTIFQALAEPTRREIIETLAKKGRLTATAIAGRFRSSPPAVSQHLKVLREAKLVIVEKKARQRIYRINPGKMLELEHWAKKITDRWNERLGRLDGLLTKEKNRIFINIGDELSKKKH